MSWYKARINKMYTNLFMESNTIMFAQQKFHELWVLIYNAIESQLSTDDIKNK